MTNFLNNLKKFMWKLAKAQEGGRGQNHFQGGGGGEMPPPQPP